MNPLRPPADADNFRVKAGRFGDRFYIDPLPADDTWDADDEDHIYPAISTVKKAVGQDWTRAAIKRLAKQPSQLADIAGLTSEFERKERLNLVSDSGLDQASGRGNVVHAHAEAKLANRLPIYEMNDVVKPYIRTLETFFDAYNPKMVAIEFVAIHRGLNKHLVQRGNTFFGYGGTGDAVVEIDGKLYMVDWKSRTEDSDHRAYCEEAGQVSAYGRADYWIVADPESPTGCKRIKPLELEGGLIVSIKPDSYECFPIDLDEGFDYWSDLHAWWQGRRSETRPIKKKWPPRQAPSQLEVKTKPVFSVENNKERFKALPANVQNDVRAEFKNQMLNPNHESTAEQVSIIITNYEHRPSIREMQDARKENEPPPSTGASQLEERMENEGGPADEAIIEEAKMVFDMSLDEDGKKWTSLRVKEANDADASFQVSRLKSVKRANIYLALVWWASWRGEDLKSDEREGNIEFSGLLYTIEGHRNPGGRTLGERLGMLTPKDAERLAVSVNEVVQSSVDDKPVIQPEETTTGN